MTAEHERAQHSSLDTRRAILAVLIVLLALAIRLPDLGNRPMHADESVHAVKFEELWKHGTYRYDPNEYHGPTLYYAALPSVWAHGRKDFGDLRESDLRLPTALFGAAICLLALLAVTEIGWIAALAAALLLAVSPAFVFYSRYFIQEILFAFFAMGAILAGWRTARTGKIGWALGTGFFASLAVATKETAILSLVAAVIAFFFARTRPSIEQANRPPRFNLLVAAATVTVIFAALFLSTFLSNLAGPVDYLRSFTPWIGRAHGTEMHRHPWYYYFSLLTWWHGNFGSNYTEGLVVGLGLIGMLAACLPGAFRVPEERRPFLRFVTVYTLVLTLIYTAIPYKTPWNVLQFLMGFALLAGVAVDALVRLNATRPAKVLAVAAFLAGSAQLGWQAYRASFLEIAKNPYAYSPTIPDAIALSRRAEELATLPGKKTAVAVIASDGYYWPLPWYLRRIPDVGYWTSIPAGQPLPVVIASSDLDEALDAKLHDSHIMIGYSGIRPGVSYETWVELKLWEAYLKVHPPVRD